MTDVDFDVMIVGAGLSGIGAACHLQRECPGKSYAVLEARESIGGTWDLFRYPGIRSDSDMHTLGYKFKPWRGGKSLADGPAIKRYVEEAADEYGVVPNIKFGHKVRQADWSSEDACWQVTAETTAGDSVMFRAKYLMMCSGYYDYAEPYQPDFPGQESFAGKLIHPQHWPEDLDYAGKKVVVIGSGATAVTLIPAMAEAVESIVMLQRSPTYIASRPARDKFANFLRKVLPENWAYAFTRWKNVMWQNWFYKMTRTKPEKMKERLLNQVREELGPDYDVDKHFTPSYNPWDQRLCLVPDNDLFEAIRSNKASVVTDEIEQFTEDGITLKSGEQLKADIVISATGLSMISLGKARFSVDGELVNFADTWTYRGAMYSGVPNLVSTFGYINASWTLRADIIAEFFCRMIQHVDSTGTEMVTPRLRPEDADMKPRLWIEGFPSGYMQRGLGQYPKQGDREPWTNPQIYLQEKKFFLTGTLEDGVLQYERAKTAVSGAVSAAA
ncbi:MAG: NAD(P)/FAD-dependent oxidoreductase [Halieaceae bacterium]